MARRKLIPGRIALFGYEVAVDWADPESDVTDDAVNRVKNVYIRNLKPTTSEFTVWSAFNSIRPGSIEKVKKAEDRDFAYVFFHKREDAIHAVQMMNGKLVDGQEVHVSLGKPYTLLKQTAGNKPLGIIQNPNFGASGFHCNDSQFGPCVFGSRPPPSRIQHPYGVPNPTSFGSPCNDFGNMHSFPAKQNLSVPIIGSVGCAQTQGVQREPVPGPKLLGGPGFPCRKPGPSWPNERKLRPALTMDHIAKIKCPVTLLSELCTRLDLGAAAPHYILLLDETGQSGSKYVYQVQFGNNIYTPPVSSDTVEEAKRIAAQYVIDQIAPWLKLKLDMLVAKPTASMPLTLDNGSMFSYFRQMGSSAFPPPSSSRNGGVESASSKSPGEKIDSGTHGNAQNFAPGFTEAMHLQSYPDYLKHLNPAIPQKTPASAGGISMSQKSISSAF